MDDRRKLSSYLINTNFQGKFLLVFGAFGFMQTVVFFYAFSQIFSQVRAFVDDGYDPEFFTSQMLQMESSVYMLFGGMFILLMVVFLIIGFRFTHKTAGAVYHMQKTFMDSEKAGCLQEMKMRDGDFFREAERAYNDMVKKLK